MKAMNDKQRKAILKLIDEAERTYLALLDDGQDCRSLSRAIEDAKEAIAIKITPGSFPAGPPGSFSMKCEPETHIVVVPLEHPFLVRR